MWMTFKLVMQSSFQIPSQGNHQSCHYHITTMKYLTTIFVCCINQLSIVYCELKCQIIFTNVLLTFFTKFTSEGKVTCTIPSLVVHCSMVVYLPLGIWAEIICLEIPFKLLPSNTQMHSHAGQQTILLFN